MALSADVKETMSFTGMEGNNILVFLFIGSFEDRIVSENRARLNDFISFFCRLQTENIYNLKSSIFNAFKEISYTVKSCISYKIIL
jgi:hypothetical protein